jgi:murein DD-endopeptidase MepM/ murein hydrolase activator NlpD
MSEMHQYLLLLSATVIVTAAAVPHVQSTQSTNPPELNVTVKSRAPLQPGEVAVVTVRAKRDIARAQVHVFDRQFIGYRVDGRTWRVLVGIDLETAPRTYSGEVAVDDYPMLRLPLRVTPRQFRTRKLTVDPAFVNPPPDAVERINREAAELNDLWSHSEATKLWTGTFVRPVPDEANSAFGTRSILNGEPRSPHSGADFNSPTGTPIKAPNAGRVVLAGDRYFTGNTVMIDHGLALFSLFAHLSEVDVRVGDTVAAGDVIGKVGATGRVTGPHLHWSVRINGARIDPLSLLSVMGDNPKQR